MFKHFRGYLVFSLPLLFKYLFLWVFIDLYLFEKGDLLEDFLFCFAILTVLSIDVFRKQFFINIIFILYLLYFILETTSYIAISSNFSSSYMFLLIDSSEGELHEFISSYVNAPIIVFIIVMIILFFIMIKMRLNFEYKINILLGSICFLGIVILLKFTGLIERNAYHNMVRGTYGYFELQKNVKFNEDISKDKIKITSNNEVLVVVLGESTTRQHMQIYGYNRETTPLLNSIKDSLLIYNNVISTDVITIKSIPKILTSLNNNSEIEIPTNLIEVFNKAGFKTYWLSNQRPIGYYDNQISGIASVSGYLKFFNYEDEVKTSGYDEVLIPEYKNVLDHKGKKVIFISLIGTHFDYFKRYPNKFEKFKSKSKALQKEKITNYYDNAVLYNDFIVYSFIKELKKQNKKSALLYFSDHGENVYDNSNFFGRSETILRKSMFEIPFLVWTSKDFELPLNFEYLPNRAFLADHTYESIGHLFGVMYSDMDMDKSIFSNTFKERKRIVIDNINYDSYFLKNHE